MAPLADSLVSDKTKANHNAGKIVWNDVCAWAKLPSPDDDVADDKKDDNEKSKPSCPNDDMKVPMMPLNELTKEFCAENESVVMQWFSTVAAYLLQAEKKTKDGGNYAPYSIKQMLSNVKIAFLKQVGDLNYFKKKACDDNEVSHCL